MRSSTPLLLFLPMTGASSYPTITATIFSTARPAPPSPTPLPEQQGTGKLQFPNTIYFQKGQIFAALKHRPALQVFDRREGTLVNEVKIDHKIFEGLASELAGTEAGKTSLPTYVAGVSAVGESVFVLLHLPRLEIVEFDLRGRERASYYSDDLPTIANYFGFDAHSKGD